MADAIRLTSPILSEITADSDHYPADDARFVVGSETISAHRQFLCMISPVLQNYFTNDSIESQTGTINVTDFTIDVVKNVVDFCYGRDVGLKKIPEIVDMLRFADKYDIKSVTKKLEHLPCESLNLDNFCIVVRYAYDLELSELFEVCCKFYGKNVSSLALSEGFIGLPWEAQKQSFFENSPLIQFPPCFQQLRNVSIISVLLVILFRNSNQSMETDSHSLKRVVSTISRKRLKL